MNSGDRGDRALASARAAVLELQLGQTKTAIWYALLALEIDRNTGLAWAVLSRVVLEVCQDPLGTMGLRHALALGVPEPDGSEVDRYYRVDLWTRGLLEHAEKASLLPLTTFGDQALFRETARLDPWIREQIEEWGSEEGALESLRKMAASFADALEAPATDENPLKVALPWTETKAYIQWKASDPLAGRSSAAPPRQNDPAVEAKLSVLSDYWIEQEIMRLGAQGSFEMALERGRLWAQLRPQGLRARAGLVRVLHANGLYEEREQIIEEIIAAGSRDLNELEEARIALGELELWPAQIRILDQMDAVIPGHPVILANRGVARIQIGQPEEGEADLERALVADPSYGPALANLGLQKMRADQYAAARGLLERAVAVAPQQAQVRVYLAACKNNQNDRAGAISELEEALRIDPKHAQAKELLEQLRARGPIPN